jgi:hypothetical protein
MALSGSRTANDCRKIAYHFIVRLPALCIHPGHSTSSDSRKRADLGSQVSLDVSAFNCSPLFSILQWRTFPVLSVAN